MGNQNRYEPEGIITPEYRRQMSLGQRLSRGLGRMIKPFFGTLKRSLVTSLSVLTVGYTARQAQVNITLDRALLGLKKEFANEVCNGDLKQRVIDDEGHIGYDYDGKLDVINAKRDSLLTAWRAKPFQASWRVVDEFKDLEMYQFSLNPNADVKAIRKYAANQH